MNVLNLLILLKEIISFLLIPCQLENLRQKNFKLHNPKAKICLGFYEPMPEVGLIMAITAALPLPVDRDRLICKIHGKDLDEYSGSSMIQCIMGSWKDL